MNKLTNPISLIKQSFGLFFKKENFIYFVKISLPPLVLGAIQVLLFQKNLQDGLYDLNYMLFIPFVIAWSLVWVWYQAANLESVIRVQGGGKLEFKDTYKKAWGYALRLFAVSLVAGLIVFGGLILLIVPGIVFSVWYAFPQFAVATKYLGVRAALSESKSLSKDKFWKTLGHLAVFVLFSIAGQIVFSIVPYGIGGVIATVFGALFLLPYYLLYLELGDNS